MEPATAAAVRWLHTPPNVQDEPLVVITEALLPVFDWIDVPVVRAVEQRLAAVERFLIEAALRLGDLDVEDIEELTALPEEATRRIAGHLCEISVLHAEDGKYIANEEAALATLTRESLVELRQDVLTFLVLPRSGDTLAFEHKHGRTAPPQLHRIDPVASAPVPGTYHDATPTAMLRTLIAASQAPDLPEDVVEIMEPPDSKPVPDVCPAYRYSGRLRLRSGQVKATGHAYGERGEERIPLDLSRAKNLIEYWLNQAELLYLAEVFQAACHEIGCSPTDAKAQRVNPSHWAFQVNTAAAQELSRRGVRLCRPGGLELLSPDRTTKIEVVASFEPSGPEAATIFAIDAAADMLEELPPDSLTPADLARAVATACTTYQVKADLATELQVRTRLWARGSQYLVYKLRAGEDFAYD
jgi:hypothetical protein